MLLKNWCSIHARCSKSSLKHSICFCGIFSKFKTKFYLYRFSRVSSSPDSIFEIHRLWQSGFSRVHSDCCCSCSFEPEIIKNGQSSHKMYSNNILNSQESTTIVNTCTKKVWKLIEGTTYIMFPNLFLIVPISQKELLSLKILQKTSPGLHRFGVTMHVLPGFVCFGSSLSYTDRTRRANFTTAGDRDVFDLVCLTEVSKFSRRKLTSIIEH